MNNVSFTGINLSNIDINKNKISIYQITEKDRPLVTKLKKKINLKELIPKIRDDEFEIYDYILKKGLETSLFRNNESMLLTCNKIPSGIIVNKNNKTTQIVDYICTWPFKVNQKTPFGGQLLFEETFKNFLNTDKSFIELYATRFGDAVSKYQKLGFSSLGGDNFTELMRISREKVQASYLKLKEKLNLIQSNSNEDIDLTDVLEI